MKGFKKGLLIFLSGWTSLLANAGATDLSNPYKIFGPFTGPVSSSIQINQCGYYTYAPKVAIVVGETSSKSFYVLSANLKDTVFTGTLSGEKKSAFSSAVTKVADFSSLQQQGYYVVDVPGMGHSFAFEIGGTVYYQVAVATIKGFYFQRASMPLIEQFAGKWHRAAGHPDTEVFIHPSATSAQRPAATKISTPYGWYDAGDYNKYVVNSGITMGTLLSAYEVFPHYFDTLNTHIPESNDKVPDILNEVVYNLRWMLTMQDPHDGGVYHKCTNASFDGMIMPDAARSPRFVVQKGTAATLDFAAVMAQASRVFKRFSKQLPRLSDSCLTAATQAWQWARQNPAIEYDQNAINKLFEPKITTGAYGDKSFKDEWFWAAAELFVTTGHKNYLDTVLNHANDNTSLPSWSNVQLLGYYSLLHATQKSPAYKKTANARNLFTQKLIALADDYLSKVPVNAFQTVMGQSKNDFVWGSNATAANQGILLIHIYLLTKNKKYLDGALTNLDYLLGRNATGYCFVTGIGSKSPQHPHHRPSIADGIPEPVPGLLVGGPNPGRQDGCHYDYIEPETAYADDDCAYASNEIAINWNAPIVFVANALEALKGQAGYSKK